MEFDDNVQYEVERVCRSCELPELILIAKEMEIEVSEDKTKKDVLRLVQEKFDESEKTERVELFITLLPKFPTRMQESLEKLLKD